MDGFRPLCGLETSQNNSFGPGSDGRRFVGILGAVCVPLTGVHKLSSPE